MTEVQPGKGTTTSGTPKYMAPELMTGRPATVQARHLRPRRDPLPARWPPTWTARSHPAGSGTSRTTCCGRTSPPASTAPPSAGLPRRPSWRRGCAASTPGAPDARPQRREQAALERARRRRRILAPVAAALAVFAVAMGIQARRISLEAARAEREAAASREVSRFLVDLFELADSARQRGDTVTARELLDRGAERLQRWAGNRPPDPGAARRHHGRRLPQARDARPGQAPHRECPDRTPRAAATRPPRPGRQPRQRRSAGPPPAAVRRGREAAARVPGYPPGDPRPQAPPR